MANNSIIPTVPAEGRPPCVLQVIPALVSGGVERGTIDLARALVEAGWDAVVASAGGPMERELIRTGATHVKLPLATKNPFGIRRNAGALAEVIRRHRVDIVHARSRAPAWSAWMATNATRRHFVTTFHNAYGTGLPLKHRYNSVMARGERVIAISEFVAEHVVKHYGVGPTRLRTIPRGVDLGVFDPNRVSGDRVVALANQWRIPEGAAVVVLPGRLTRWKGGLDFIDAVARLGRRDICCVLVGAEQRRGFRRELERAIERRGVIGLFRIVEDCRDMAAAYVLADVVVSASTDPEGFGRILVEGQAMGRPVVATDHGGARETIVPGSTGWLVSPRDSGALAAAINDALNLTSEERDALGLRAMTHIAAHFTRDAMCARTIDVYEELLFPAITKAPVWQGEPLAISA
ncbi:MAG TPA: glycosyltransferase family 4 protein [Stellaceae bacterium]|jgi:glycosyltransferase involved in cell wall biosynthesis|nr:glycosyltransferase family 4 protein [Stellaceae bacterium]